ncbi:hypothetical protein PSTT_15707 [Puccinia striiformis]|uniref:Uncharacterized protein n=1 Tax=Puccinia striiformis TaxID=27350 RepID=A0A2S4UG93_9BASI|nr:hypothetical protein PSTT_15707 [Puccinia striiformis]
MAQLASEETPSTPPNTTNDSTDRHPPQSSRLRTPSTRPGFIPTITDSRRSLVPAARPSILRPKRTIVNDSEDDVDNNDSGGDNDDEMAMGTTIVMLLAMTMKTPPTERNHDLDEENSKVTGRKKKDPTKTRTVQIMLGFISILREKVPTRKLVIQHGPVDGATTSLRFRRVLLEPEVPSRRCQD